MVRPTYHLEARHPRSETAYSFSSADGVHSKKALRRSETLLADAVDVSAASKIYVHRGNYGVLSVLLGDEVVDGTVTMTDRSARAVALAEHNVAENKADNVSVELDYEPPGSEYAASLYAPRPYESVDMVKAELLDLVEATKTGGLVCVAADQSSGFRRYKSFLDSLPGGSQVVARDESYRVVTYEVSEEPLRTSVDPTSSFTDSWRDVEASFTAFQGLFSNTGLDAGTQVLLEALPSTVSGDVLDLCCGYGAIGVFLAKQHEASLTLSDDDVLATQAARINCDDNSVGARVVTRDCLSGFQEDSFDVIVTNPPTHAGRGVLEELVLGSQICLRDNGCFYAVFNDPVGFDDLLRPEFSVERLVDDDFVVVRATPR